jgi:hypothetical protein
MKSNVLTRSVSKKSVLKMEKGMVGVPVKDSRNVSVESLLITWNMTLIFVNLALNQNNLTLSSQRTSWKF